MTILEMFEREDIYHIIEGTLEEYYRNVLKKKVSVKVDKNHFFKRILIYPRLGVIISRTPSWSVVKNLYRFFDVQNNLPKKLFAWSYITLCILTFGLLSDASLVLDDTSVFSNNHLIMPCNRKIKVFDYKNQIIDAYQKKGFSNYYLKKEIEVRRQPEVNFILPMLDSGERWYRERLLLGRCLVRTSGDVYNRYMAVVLEYLGQYYQKSLCEIAARDYLLQLAEEYEKMLKRVEEQKKITCGDKIRRVIRWSADIARKTHDTIPTAMGHGDLQTGNIYVDEEHDRVFLIDWETVKRRSVWYDAATVIFCTRRKNKFSDMLNSIDDERYMKKILWFDKNRGRETNVVAAVLLIEELGFFLEEIVDLPGEMGAEIIERYEYEIDRIEWNHLGER